MPDDVQNPSEITAQEPEFSNPDEIVDPYDDNGNHLWEHIDTGEPVDHLGNVIPAQRPEPVAPDVAPIVAAAEPEPELDPTPVAPSTQFRSPFAEGLLTDDERAAADELVSPQAMALIETVASRIAARTIAADRQHSRAARDLGLPDEYGDRMAEMHQYVPANLKGTRQGAIVAAALAAAQEAMESGDIQSVFRKLGGAATAVAPPSAPAAPPVRQPLPPSSVTHTPVGSPDAPRAAARQRPERTIAGLSPAELAIINKDRAARNGGNW